jgi:hypothetical protein
MKERPELETAYARVVTERDEAIAERDFILKFVGDIGMALSRGHRTELLPADDGVELRALYDCRADAMAAAMQIGALIGMVNLAGLTQDDGARRPTVH